LQNLGANDDESEGTFVHDRGLLDTEWELEELDSIDELKMVRRISILVVNFHPLKCRKHDRFFLGFGYLFYRQ